MKWNAIQNTWEYNENFKPLYWPEIVKKNADAYKSYCILYLKLFTFKHKHHKYGLHILSGQIVLLSYLKKKKKQILNDLFSGSPQAL